jgi:hypothetical protein
MSTFEHFEHIAVRHSLPYGLRDPLAVGLRRRLNGIVAHLRGEVRVVRLAVCCGFAGAVLLQAGLLSLLARLVLMLDGAVLPGPTASAYCAIIGAAAMLASRVLNAPRIAATSP